MNPCADKELLLGALLDGELDAANVQAMEAHLRACPACAEAFKTLEELRGRLQEPGLRPTAPAALRARIAAAAEAEARPASRARRGVLPWAMSGGFAALAAGLAAVLVLQPGAGSLEDQLVADHVRSTLAAHLVDVQTSDRHVVKPWFNGKVDFAPPVVDLADAGFPLAGGRLDYLDGRVVAALVYRRGGHVINVFVWPEGEPPRPPAFALRRQHAGYAIAHWTARGLNFWAVSDIDPPELQRLRAAFVARTGG
jgi:anti-sigma factor RsiW